MQKTYSIGTTLFDLKKAGPISWVGQNARTKSVIKPIFYWCIYELMAWLFEVYVIFPLWCFIVEIWIHVCFGEFMEDVTSISWIIIILTWFIVLIEVGRYKLVSKPGWSCPHQNSAKIVVCIQHVWKYYRYLLCCSVLLCGFERSGVITGFY